MLLFGNSVLPSVYLTSLIIQILMYLWTELKRNIVNLFQRRSEVPFYNFLWELSATNALHILL